MSRSAYFLVTFWGLLLTGCQPSSTTTMDGADVAERILGKWEMIEDREHPRHEPPTEIIEFSRGGGFVLRMNGKVEMEGRFRVQGEKVLLMRADGENPMGDPMTIKRLTAHSLVLTNEAGRDSEFVRR